MHWLLDVLFGGDSCRIQTKTAQQNLNMVRKLALNIMRMYKQETKSKIALTALMFKSLLDPYQLLHILGKNGFPCHLTKQLHLSTIISTGTHHQQPD